jgi:hypothetical protein
VTAEADGPAPQPLLRVVVGNALALAAGYLAVGLLVETLRRIYPARSVLTLSFALDALPARVLSLFGLLEPLREAYISGQLGEAGLRAVFGLTALGVIFFLAAVLGGVAAVVRSFFRHPPPFGE